MFLFFSPLLSFDFISTFFSGFFSWQEIWGTKTKHLRGDQQWSGAELDPPLFSLCPTFPHPLRPILPLLSAQWKSLITGGESNPWHWMKDKGLPPSLSFSQSLSLSSFFPWMLVMLGRFSPLVLIRSLFHPLALCFSQPTVLVCRQVQVSGRKLLRLQPEKNNQRCFF